MWYARGLCAILLLSLSSCGFRPQFAALSEKDVSFFSQVEIPPIKDRYGQILHNNITETLGTKSFAKSAYLFKVTLDVTIRDVGYDRDLSSSRAEALLVAKYDFSNRKSSPQDPSASGVCRTSEYFNRSYDKIFQNITAEKNAPLRGLETLSRCLIDRLSLLLLKESQP